MHRIAIVTPAGRRIYLDLLKEYILNEDSISEWILWDNCRKKEDRDYINDLEQKYDKIKIIRIDNTDGTNRSVNRFYKFCNDKDVFYIKLDDDIVWTERGFAMSIYERAVEEAGQYAWWSPLVINNAVCSWLLKYHSPMHISSDLSAQASDDNGWKNPIFAEKLHNAFLNRLGNGTIDDLHVGDHTVSLSRFSINCIGFFGSDLERWGDDFCPPDVSDEEWISAVLPSKIGLSGRVIGNVLVAHYGFYPQEEYLLTTNILDRYYKYAGLTRVAEIPPPKAKPLKARIRRSIELRWFSGDRAVDIR